MNTLPLNHVVIPAAALAHPALRGIRASCAAPAGIHAAFRVSFGAIWITASAGTTWGAHFARPSKGFTLIELLLVLLLVALLASLVAPVVTGSIHRAKESTLKEDVYAMRKAIDDYYADNGAYPAELEELVKKRYLRRIPVDPITEKRDTWTLLRAEDDESGKGGGIIDVHSGSEERAGDGTYYKDW